MKHIIVQCIEIGITVGGNDETVLFLTNTLYIHISPHIYMRFNFIIVICNLQQQISHTMDYILVPPFIDVHFNTVTYISYLMKHTKPDILQSKKIERYLTNSSWH